MVYKIGKLLKAKIQAHSEEDTQLFTASDTIKNTNPSLVSVMYRLATDDFVKNSTAIFKIIECRNSTKLVTDWKPSLVDILISLGHQVIVVELKEFPHYTDFVYSILRQIDYCWKNRLPRSFFYPEDVCFVESSLDKQLVIVSPLMPDGDIDLTNQMQDNLTYEILMMLKDSCASGLKNHLLKRDLRVGKFSDTQIGVNSIRHVYRTLQQRVNSEGENIQMGHTTGNSSSESGENFHQFLITLAGESLMTAQSYIDYCKNPNDQEEPSDMRGGAGDTHHINDDGHDKIVHLQPNETGDFQTKNPNEAAECCDVRDDVFDQIIDSLQEIQQNKLSHGDSQDVWEQLEDLHSCHHGESDMTSRLYSQ